SPVTFSSQRFGSLVSCAFVDNAMMTPATPTSIQRDITTLPSGKNEYMNSRPNYCAELPLMDQSPRVEVRNRRSCGGDQNDLTKVRESIVAPDNFPARDRGQGAENVGRRVLPQEMHATVAKNEVASTRMPAAEAADPIFPRAVVAEAVRANDSWGEQNSVHGFVARIGRHAELCRGREDRTVIRLRRVGDPRGAPRLFDDHKAAIAIDDRLGGVFQVAHQQAGRSPGRVAKCDRQARPVRDLRDSDGLVRGIAVADAEG